MKYLYIMSHNRESEKSPGETPKNVSRIFLINDAILNHNKSKSLATESNLTVTRFWVAARG